MRSSGANCSSSWNVDDASAIESSTGRSPRWSSRRRGPLRRRGAVPPEHLLDEDLAGVGEEVLDGSDLPRLEHAQERLGDGVLGGRRVAVAEQECHAVQPLVVLVVERCELVPPSLVRRRGIAARARRLTHRRRNLPLVAPGPGGTRASAGREASVTRPVACRAVNQMKTRLQSLGLLDRALRAMTDEELDTAVAALGDDHREAMERLVGGEVTPDSIREAAAKGRIDGTLESIGLVITDAPLADCIEQLGDHADNPTSEQLRAVLPGIIERHGLGVTRLMTGVDVDGRGGRVRGPPRPAQARRHRQAPTRRRDQLRTGGPPGRARRRRGQGPPSRAQAAQAGRRPDPPRAGGARPRPALTSADQSGSSSPST